MERRGEKDFNLDEVVKLDDERRKILQEVEVMKNELNTASKNIPNLIKEGKDVENEKIKLKSYLIKLR